MVQWHAQGRHSCALAGAATRCCPYGTAELTPRTYILWPLPPCALCGRLPCSAGRWFVRGPEGCGLKPHTARLVQRSALRAIAPARTPAGCGGVLRRSACTASRWPDDRACAQPLCHQAPPHTVGASCSCRSAAPRPPPATRCSQPARARVRVFTPRTRYSGQRMARQALPRGRSSLAEQLPGYLFDASARTLRCLRLARA